MGSNEGDYHVPKEPRAPRFWHGIDIADLNGQKQLPDGDKIMLTDVGPASSSANVGFELELKRDMWWKGFVLFDLTDENNWKEVVAGDWADLQKANYSLRTKEILGSELASHYTVLSKAKTFGAHANVYQVQDSNATIRLGRKYRISWTQD